MIQLNSVYNFLSPSISPKPLSYSKKSSNLKSVYSNMVKVNKQAPIYKLTLSKEKQEFLIGIKEGAMALKDITCCFSDNSNEIYQKKCLFVDNENAMKVSSINKNYENLPYPLTIDIQKLATPQSNIGRYVNSDYSGLLPGPHTFSISTTNNKYDFSIDVSSGDTNYDILQNIAYSINSRNIGIDSSFIQKDDTSAISLTSTQTGIASTDDGLLFNIIDTDSGRTIVDYFGLNSNITPSDNAYFSINGQNNSAISNNISVNNTLEIDFINQGLGPANISITPDLSDVLERIDEFINGYNSLINYAKTNSENDTSSNLLTNDLKAITKSNLSKLESAGLILNNEGIIKKDEALIIQSIKSGQFTELFSDISSFKNQIIATTDKLTLNPMAYVNKTIVTYPSTRNNFPNPYTESLYSGLIYNNYA